jgi:hypothetical protein
LNLTILDSHVFLDSHVLLDSHVTIVVVVVVMMTVFRVERVEDTVGSTMETVTEGVVLAVFVVVSHIRLVPAFTRPVDRSLFGDPDVLVEADGVSLWVAAFRVVAWGGALVLPAARSSVLLGEWDGAVSEVSLSYVDAGVDVDLGSWGVSSIKLAVVDAVLNVDLVVCVTLVRFPVAGSTRAGVSHVDKDVD